MARRRRPPDPCRGPALRLRRPERWHRRGGAGAGTSLNSLGPAGVAAERGRRPPPPPPCPAPPRPGGQSGDPHAPMFASTGTGLRWVPRGRPVRARVCCEALRSRGRA
ncbi:unnamed protein product [Coccothraustes coccothraustes]